MWYRGYLCKFFSHANGDRNISYIAPLSLAIVMFPPDFHWVLSCMILWRFISSTWMLSKLWIKKFLRCYSVTAQFEKRIIDIDYQWKHSLKSMDLNAFLQKVVGHDVYWPRSVFVSRLPVPKPFLFSFKSLKIVYYLHFFSHLELLGVIFANFFVLMGI